MFKKASLLATGLALALVSACGTHHTVVVHQPVLVIHHNNGANVIVHRPAPRVVVHLHKTVIVHHTVVHHVAN